MAADVPVVLEAETQEVAKDILPTTVTKTWFHSMISALVDVLRQNGLLATTSSIEQAPDVPALQTLQPARATSSWGQSYLLLRLLLHWS